MPSAPQTGRISELPPECDWWKAGGEKTRSAQKRGGNKREDMCNVRAGHHLSFVLENRVLCAGVRL